MESRRAAAVTIAAKQTHDAAVAVALDDHDGPVADASASLARTALYVLGPGALRAMHATVHSGSQCAAPERDQRRRPPRRRARQSGRCALDPDRRLRSEARPHTHPGSPVCGAASRTISLPLSAAVTMTCSATCSALAGSSRWPVTCRGCTSQDRARVPSRPTAAVAVANDAAGSRDGPAAGRCAVLVDAACRRRRDGPHAGAQARCQAGRGACEHLRPPAGP